MTRRDLIFLFLLGLAVPLAIAQFQSLPGYMDADYYYGGGIQLARGNGFNEPYLWNYLSDPQAIPTPSHAYWMPLASIVAAAGMRLTGQTSFGSARIGFILLAALVPLITSLLAYRLTSSRVSSFLSGLLACFPIYYAPFLPDTDNYAIYMLLGASFFLLLSSLQPPTANRQPLIPFFLFGLLSALMTLARSDGLLWLGMTIFVAVWFASTRGNTHASMQIEKHNSQLATSNSYLFFRSFIFHLSSFIFFTLLGFLSIMSFWYARNLQAFGSIMAPGASRALWLTTYNETFLYPASQLTMQSWLASGWQAIVQARLSALRLNLMNAFAAQGGIFLFPFILVGAWQLRRDARVRFAALAWTLLFVAMTLVFPFAGARGAFYHSGAALQPVWWSLAPVGLDSVIASARRKGWFDERAFTIFRGALVGIAMLMTAVIFTIRVLPGWEREDGHYAAIETLLIQTGAPADAIVMVRNPPGYNIVTGRTAIVVPTGGTSAVLAAAAAYHARYLVIEPGGISGDLCELYDQPEQFPAFRYLGESDGNRLYAILP